MILGLLMKTSIDLWRKFMGWTLWKITETLKAGNLRRENHPNYSYGKWLKRKEMYWA